MFFDSHIMLLIIYTASALEHDINFLNSNGLFLLQGVEKFVPKIRKKQKVKSIETEKLSVIVYYETLCPYSMEFYTNGLVSVVKKLSPYLNLTTNPYGNAETFEKEGTYRFKCQHGPRECYGNKLHACTVDVLQNITKAVIFNACMITKGEFDGSNDETADACGKEQNIDVNPIKECAKGDKGIQLLKVYGDASKKINLDHVPCVYINGEEENDWQEFEKDICAAFTNPPPPCKKQTKKYHRHSPKMTH